LRGVILAAGCGTRLSAYRGRRSKVLMQVEGRSIIDYTLDAFRQVGVTDLVIVIGYEGDALRECVGDGSDRGLSIQYVFNPDYERGNALSLYATRPLMDEEPFLLSMADHVVSPELLSRMLEIRKPVNALAVDYTTSARHLEESTHVMVDWDSRITHIGKEIPRWNGVDAGVFQLTPAIFDALEECIGEEQEEHQLSQAITRMIKGGDQLWACDISSCFWHDIDTLDDLNVVRRVMAGEEAWTNQRTA